MRSMFSGLMAGCAADGEAPTAIRTATPTASVVATVAATPTVMETEAPLLSPLQGKTIIFLGSSVTEGSAADGESFVEILAQRDGIIPIKEAVSGTTLVDQDETSYIARLKTIDPAVRADVVAKRTGFYDACGQGIFCNLGKGVTDFQAVRKLLLDSGYQGWCTVEQDCDPTLDVSPISDARKNREYLSSMGFN